MSALFPLAELGFRTEWQGLFWFEVGIAGFFVLFIFFLIVFFVVRYRRRSDDEVPPRLGTHYGLEAFWTGGVFVILLVFFFWGAWLYVKMKRPLDNALVIHVVGKQWMWKIQHADGPREIDELHVPVGRPVKLIMASEDVIHSFFIPEFHVKQDVVPGSYSTEWFVADKPGVYHFFCSQYCGTNHSRMVGKVIALMPSEYQAWLAGAIPADPPAAAGRKLFISYGCTDCHGERAPTMAGLYGSTVQLSTGRSIVADEEYLRQSIINPNAQLVAGYPPIMPTFRGQLTEEQIFQIIAYIKSLAGVRANPPATNPSLSPAPTTVPQSGNSPLRVPNYPPAEAPVPIVPPGRPD